MLALPIRPALLGIREHQIERVGGPVFGVANSPWATVFGVTIGDANRASRSRHWSAGAGGWRPPLWSRHPVPLGLDVYLLVRSPSYHGVLEGFEPADMSRAKVVNVFDQHEIVADVEAFFAGLEEFDWDQLVRSLSARFVVEDV